jgi:tight adherence protein B
MTMALPDYVVLVSAIAVTMLAAGLVAGSALFGLLLAGLTALGGRLLISFRTARRRRAFADQLQDSLQLLASSLRAGHSMLQALNSVAREAEAPTSEEFTRVINEVRVSRGLTEVLHETASRMGSNDFVWVTQAIAINREVGGNLAEVLDGVGHTIRERNQIRRQVKALSAEGKMSALVLMVLPVGISGFLYFSNRPYLMKFTESLIGYALIGLCLLLMTVGGIWLAKVTKISF